MSVPGSNALAYALGRIELISRLLVVVYALTSSLLRHRAFGVRRRLSRHLAYGKHPLASASSVAPLPASRLTWWCSPIVGSSGVGPTRSREPSSTAEVGTAASVAAQFFPAAAFFSHENPPSRIHSQVERDPHRTSSSSRKRVYSRRWSSTVDMALLSNKHWISLGERAPRQSRRAAWASQLLAQARRNPARWPRAGAVRARQRIRSTCQASPSGRSGQSQGSKRSTVSTSAVARGQSGVALPPEQINALLCPALGCRLTGLSALQGCSSDERGRSSSHPAARQPTWVKAHF